MQFRWCDRRSYQREASFEKQLHESSCDSCMQLVAICTQFSSDSCKCAFSHGCLIRRRYVAYTLHLLKRVRLCALYTNHCVIGVRLIFRKLVGWCKPVLVCVKNVNCRSCLFDDCCLSAPARKRKGAGGERPGGQAARRMRRAAS